MLIFGIIVCALGAANILASVARINRPKRRQHIATGLITMAAGGLLIGFS